MNDKKSENNNKTIRLTASQEIYVQELVKGKTQRQAYYIAYPHTKKWKPGSVDTNASLLLKKPKVAQRFQQLTDEIREEETKKTLWTREESIKTLRFVIDMNQSELNRVHDVYEEELALLLKEMETVSDPDELRKLVNKTISRRKDRRITQTNNKGIIDAVAELNKMQGFNEENINLGGNVIFSGAGDLED